MFTGVMRMLRACSSWPKRAMLRKFAEPLIILESVALVSAPPQRTSPIYLLIELNVIALLDVDRRRRA
eukprot:113492-Pleurochrysis_carterae.AAC.2